MPDMTTTIELDDSLLSNPNNQQQGSEGTTKQTQQSSISTGEIKDPKVEEPIKVEETKKVDEPIKEGEPKKETETPKEETTSEDSNPFEFYLENDLKHIGVELTAEESKLFEGMSLDTPEDHAKYVSTIGKLLNDRALSQWWDDLAPEDKRYLQYRADGGDPSVYFQTLNRPDFTNATISKDNKEEHVQIIAENLMKISNGAMSKEKAMATAKLYEANGTSYEEALESQKSLRAIKSQEEQTLIQRQAQQQAQEQAEYKAYIDTLSNKVLKEGTLKIGEDTYTIPQDKREIIVNDNRTYYVDDNGYYLDQDLKRTTNQNEAITVADAFMLSRDLDTQLLQYYQLRFGLDSLVKATVKQEKVNHLRKMMGNKGNNPVNQQQANNQQQEISKGNIDWKNTQIELEN